MKQKVFLLIFLIFFSIFSQSVFAEGRTPFRLPKGRLSSIREAEQVMRLRQFKLNKARQEEREGQVGRDASVLPKHPYYNNELTRQNIIDALNGGRQPSDLADIKDFFPRYSVEEINIFVGEMVREKQVVVLRVNLSNGSQHTLFMTSKNFDTQKSFITDYVRNLESFSIDNILDHFPFFMNRLIATAIINELEAQGLVVPYWAGSGWRWNGSDTTMTGRPGSFWF